MRCVVLLLVLGFVAAVKEYPIYQDGSFLDGWQGYGDDECETGFVTLNETSWFYGVIAPYQSINIVNSQEREFQEFKSLQFFLYFNDSSVPEFDARVHITDKQLGADEERVSGYAVRLYPNIKNLVVVPLQDLTCKTMKYIKIFRSECPQTHALTILIDEVKLSETETYFANKISEHIVGEESSISACQTVSSGCPTVSSSCEEVPVPIQISSCVSEQPSVECSASCETDDVVIINEVSSSSCQPEPIVSSSCEPEPIVSSSCSPEPVISSSCQPEPIISSSCPDSSSSSVEENVIVPSEISVVATCSSSEPPEPSYDEYITPVVRESCAVDVSTAIDPMPVTAPSVEARAYSEIQQDTIDDVEFVCEDGALALWVFAFLALVCIV